MSDAEFENLKEELLWNGSKVAVLDRDELTFLEASMSYAKVGSVSLLLLRRRGWGAGRRGLGA